MSELPPILNEPEEDKPPVLKSGSNFNPNSPFLWILIAIFGFVAVALIPELVKELGSFFADDSDDAPPPVQQADSFPTQPLPNPNQPPTELVHRAQTGDVEAQLALGKFYASKNIWRHEYKAKIWLQKAADQGHPGAQFELGKMYANEELDLPSEDVSHLAPLFTNVNPYNGFNLAQGIRKHKDWHEHRIASRALAKEWLHKAAAQKHVEAIFELGKLMPSQQAQRFHQAADLGHAEAQHRLAVLLAAGEPTDTSQSEAVELWGKAARGGNADAQYILGTLHRYGKLVNQNPVTAHAWLKLAVENNHPVAAQSLKALETELTPEQVAQSSEIASEILKAPRR